MRMAYIADESLTSFQVRFFGTQDSLPKFNAVGDIIRLQRVMVRFEFISKTFAYVALD